MVEKQIPTPDEPMRDPLWSAVMASIDGQREADRAVARRALRAAAPRLQSRSVPMHQSARRRSPSFHWGAYAAAACLLLALAAVLTTPNVPGGDSPSASPRSEPIDVAAAPALSVSAPDAETPGSPAPLDRLIASMSSGGVVRIAAGEIDQPVRIDKPLRIERSGERLNLTAL
jgi:hypothetical protein